MITNVPTQTVVRLAHLLGKLSLISSEETNLLQGKFPSTFGSIFAASTISEADIGILGDLRVYRSN